MTASVTRTVPCHDVRPLLSSYISGHLSLPTTQQIYAHLMDCGDCWESTDRLSNPRVNRALFLFALPAAAGLAVLLALPIISTRYHWPTQKLAAPQPAVGGEAPVHQIFQAQPGNAYYIRLHVAERPTAEKGVQRLASKQNLQQVKGPYAGRYYMTATPAQLSAFLDRLVEVGDVGITEAGKRRRGRTETNFDPNACSATLDLISS